MNVVQLQPERYAVNCSLLFTELPLLERPAAARAAGFAAVEYWWPFVSARPTNFEVAAFERAIREARVQLVALNFFAGDLTGADAGVVSVPGRTEEFLTSVRVAVEIGERLGTRRFNALYGTRQAGIAPQIQDALALANLAAAMRAAARIDATVLIEPVSGSKPYPLRTAADAMAVIEKARKFSQLGNVGLLADLYHLAANGDDIGTAINRYGADIEHVQVADYPGRHEPGSGELDITGHLCHLRANGYDGWIGLEYVPSGPSSASFADLPGGERSVGARSPLEHDDPSRGGDPLPLS